MKRGSLDDLRALIPVGRERSFTRAAAQLGVSQSALSQTIRHLEANLGVRLLTTEELTHVRPGGEAQLSGAIRRRDP